MRIIICCLVIVCCISCKHTTNTYIIPEEKFKDLLVDIHLIDGYYMMNYGKYLNVKDNKTFYKQVFDKYGYSRAQFDSSLLFYSRDTKRFDVMYDAVIDELNHMNQDVSTIRALALDSSKNLYKGKADTLIQGKTTLKKLPFEVAIKDTGLYEITIQLKRFPDDQSKKLHLTAFSTCKGCKEPNKNDLFEGLFYKKDSRLRVYKVSKRVTSVSQKLIKGFLLDQDAQDGKIQQHILIKAVFVNKIPQLKKVVPPFNMDKKGRILPQTHGVTTHVP